MVLWKFVAGIGFFLIGLQFMDDSLARLSGRRFKKFLERNTSTVPKALFSGFVLTALLQSSSVISLLTLGFVEAGMIPFRNAFGVILGANLGSTMISWIVALLGFQLDIEAWALPALALGSLGMFFFRTRNNLHHVFRVLFAIGLLFFGLGFLKASAGFWLQHVDLSKFQGSALIIFVLIGFLITAVVQSSSATMVIGMTALYAQVITLPAAACLLLGAESGTALKTFIAGLDGSPEKKRAGIGNFLFNLFTTAGAYFFVDLLIRFITDVLRIDDSLQQLAMFQTLVNMLSILLMLPFLKKFSTWLEKKFNHDHTQLMLQSPEKLNGPADPDFLEQEVNHLRNQCLAFHDLVFDVGKPIPEKWTARLADFIRIRGRTAHNYHTLKMTEGELTAYFARTHESHTDKEVLTRMEHSIDQLRHIMHAAKSVKDIHHNISELRESANDHVHGHYHRIRQQWVAFRKNFFSLDPNKDKEPGIAAAYREMQANQELIQEELKRNHISELEAATLSHIEREIVSAEKAMIQSLD